MSGVLEEIRRGYQEDLFRKSPRLRDRRSRLQKARKLEAILDSHRPQGFDDAVCLDLGCSSGIVSGRLAGRFKRLIGLEIDSSALAAIIEDDRRSAQFVRGDAMQFPVRDGSIDVIVCAQVYEHVPDDRPLFAEMKRALKSDGLILFTGPNRLFPVEPHYFLPFLHWLPQRWANRYLRLLGRGDTYYERSRSYWSLRRALSGFRSFDVTHEVVGTRAGESGAAGRLLARVPRRVWWGLAPFLPNFNWILEKC